jgi:drug/metabolite transporter (DMT)-like permease
VLLPDGFKTFASPEGDGDPVFRQSFYQSVAISLPLVLLRLPPVKRWVTGKRADGQQWKVWLLVAVIGVPYVAGMICIISEEIFTGMTCLTMHPPAN